MRLILFLGDSRDSISHRKRTRGAATPTKNFSNAIAIPASLMRASICDQQVRLSRRPTAINLAHGLVGVADTAGGEGGWGVICNSQEGGPGEGGPGRLPRVPAASSHTVLCHTSLLVPSGLVTH